MIWQIMMAFLHSNVQLMTQRDGDTEKGCQKAALQQKTTDDDYDKLKAFIRSRYISVQHRAILDKA